MSGRVYKSARAFVKNVWIHVKRVIQGKESASEAFDQVTNDTKRLRSEMKHSRGSHDHAYAARLVERGRKAYNQKQYREAEGFFRDATHEDPNYALAHTYLGNALYKLQRSGDAMYAWTKAMEVDPYSKAGQQAALKMKNMKSKKDRTINDLTDNVLNNMEKQRDRRSG